MVLSPQFDRKEGAAPFHVQIMAGFMVAALREQLADARDAHQAVESAFAACLSSMNEIEAQVIASAYARAVEEAADSLVADMALNELETRIARSARHREPPLPCGIRATMLCSLGTPGICPLDAPAQDEEASPRR